MTNKRKGKGSPKRRGERGKHKPQPPTRPTDMDQLFGGFGL